MSTVEIEVPQHMRALNSANRIRLYRAGLKAEIAVGTTPVARVLLRPTADEVGMTLVCVLKAQRRWGEQRAVKFLQKLRIPESKRVGDATERQRKLIVAELVGKLED